MAIDFFDKEAKKAQLRFNKTFGMMETCNIKTRQIVILTIISMGRLAKIISSAKSMDDVRGEIRIFMAKRELLNPLFKEAEIEVAYQQRRKELKLEEKAIVQEM